jgi:3-methyladenine DNA glycosylase/8-oxoguanine DNA glycosylase
VLLTGESEANALIDKLMPTVAKMQKDVEAIAKQQASDCKTLTKVLNSTEDCYEKISEVKDYGKDTQDDLEHVLEKVRGCRQTEYGVTHLSTLASIGHVLAWS